MREYSSHHLPCSGKAQAAVIDNHAWTLTILWHYSFGNINPGLTPMALLLLLNERMTQDTRAMGHPRATAAWVVISGGISSSGPLC